MSMAHCDGESDRPSLLLLIDLTSSLSLSFFAVAALKMMKKGSVPGMDMAG